MPDYIILHPCTGIRSPARLQFIVDRHPGNQNVWIVGGGSGHGFKHGPALGEMVAQLVLKDETADPLYRMARFEAQKAKPQTAIMRFMA